MNRLDHGRLTTGCPKPNGLDFAKGLILSNRKSFRHPHARGYKCVELYLLREISSRDTRLRVAIGGRYDLVRLLYYSSPASKKIASPYLWPLFTMSYSPDPFLVTGVCMYKNDTASTHMARLGGGMAGSRRPTDLLSCFDLVLVLPCSKPSVVAVPSSLACMFPPPVERDL